MEVIVWFVTGAIAGYLAGVAVFDDEGLGVSGHVVLGAVAGVVGGYIAAVLLSEPQPFDLSSPLTLVGSVILAALTVLIINEFTDRERLGV